MCLLMVLALHLRQLGLVLVQGLVLGPLLLLYISDLHFAIKSSETSHFADDTHFQSPESLIKRANVDLKVLSTGL